MSRRCDRRNEICRDLELKQVVDQNVNELSDGELRRFAIALVAIHNADIYVFDEPSNYLDVKKRLKQLELASRPVQQRAAGSNAVPVVV